MSFRPSRRNLKTILEFNKEGNNKADCGSSKSINSIKKLSVIARHEAISSHCGLVQNTGRLLPHSLPADVEPCASAGGLVEMTFHFNCYRQYKKPLWEIISEITAGLKSHISILISIENHESCGGCFSIHCL